MQISEIHAEKPRTDVPETEAPSSTAPETIENYLTDESRLVTGEANAVFFPRTEAHVTKILRKANEQKIQVTISGAGTGITGSRVPTGGIVLATEKMTKVADQDLSEGLTEYSDLGVDYALYILYDKEADEYAAILPPGISLETLKKILEEKNLCYPPDTTEMTALIGGTVATNASGARTFHYGCTRDFVRRLRVALPTGDVLDIKRGKVFANRENEFQVILTSGKRLTVKIPSYSMPDIEKNAAGYYSKPGMDLIDLFIGSEGTLGVITEVEIRLEAKPKSVLPVFAHFSSENDALRFVKKLRTASKHNRTDEEGLNALSIEFFDERSIALLRQKYPPSKIPEKSKSAVFFEQEIPNEKAFNKLLQDAVTLLESCNALDTMASLGTDWLREIKDIRHALPESINTTVRSKGVHKVATDIAVPESRFDEMMSFYHEVGEKSGIPYAIFGHVGNNHLHFNFIPQSEQALASAVRASTLLLKKAVELGGTITAEHGVGKKNYATNGEKGPYLELMYGIKGLKSIAAIKHVFDPTHILNIGNIIPF
ncbi:MAG: FAD-binding oxidoreductase, partial [Candidatus Bathyarchaeota archaeon]